MGSQSRSLRTEREVPHAGYTGVGSSNDGCKLSFKTKLMKPSLATTKLSVGDLLRISLSANEEISTYDSYGNFCGVVVETVWEKKLIECLKKQTEYQAQVLKKIGGSCEVKVYDI